MTDHPERQSDNAFFRGVVGFLALGAGIAGFIALFWIEIPARNENALMFAMGIVFGWGSAVIASEYGATTVGRKVAESAVRNLERQNLAGESAPSGTDDDPLKTEVINPENRPANVTERKPGD
jgi:hypothetical protein